MGYRLDDIEDPVVRENFQKLEEETNKSLFPSDRWRFVELTFLTAVTGYQYRHGLSFVPKDVIQTSAIGAGAVTWNYSSFTKDIVSITTTGAVTVRALIGKFP